MSLAFREAAPDGAPHGTVLLLHGYPESSHMWRDVLPRIADAGWRALAPDLAGLGDSSVDRPGTWERHVESIETFAEERQLGPVVLAVHDWGGLIGLAWACDHPESVAGLAISDTGFFSDGKWHGMGQAMRTEGQGEELLAGMTREGLGGLLRQISPGMSDADVDEYWKGYDGEDRRAMHLDFYRSMDFEKLAPYEGRLGELGVPTILIWGGKDAFAPVAGAHRFAKEIPGAELVVLDDAGHFVWDDEPERAGDALVGFLGRVGSA